MDTWVLDRSRIHSSANLDRICVFWESQCFSASFWARIFSRKSDGWMPEFFSMVFFSGCFRPTFPSESWWLDLAPGDNFDAENPDSRHEAPHPEAPEDLLRYREHPHASQELRAWRDLMAKSEFVLGYALTTQSTQNLFIDRNLIERSLLFVFWSASSPRILSNTTSVSIC